MAKKNPFAKGSVITIGTFDGVHLGHQALFRKVRNLAVQQKIPSIAFTFYASPRHFFNVNSRPQLLTVLNEKERIIKSLGIDFVEAYSFGGNLANLSPEKFFEKFFIKKYNAKYIVVGYDFAFGKERRGNISFLKRYARQKGISLYVIKPVKGDKGIISSGNLRASLEKNQIETIFKNMGRFYSLEGIVKKGDGRGRTLGYPTANLKTAQEKLLPQGVFAGYVFLSNGLRRKGMCNIGFRPTVQRKNGQLSVEIHLLDFWGNLLEKWVKFDLVKKLRHEKKFNSLTQLIQQLKRDETQTRKAFF